MIDTLRPLISRLLASLAPAVALWLGSKIGVDVPESTVREVFEIGLVLAVYAITHRVVDRKVSPGDTASPELAIREKREAAQIVR